MDNRFIAGGYDEARRANKPSVREEVEREFAAKLGAASTADRKRIAAEIDREIEKRLKRIAPPDALY